MMANQRVHKMVGGDHGRASVSSSGCETLEFMQCQSVARLS